MIFEQQHSRENGCAGGNEKKGTTTLNNSFCTIYLLKYVYYDAI